MNQSSTTCTNIYQGVQIQSTTCFSSSTPVLTVITQQPTASTSVAVNLTHSNLELLGGIILFLIGFFGMIWFFSNRQV